VQENGLELSALERLVLERSGGSERARRRIRLVVGSAILLSAALIVISALVQSWQLLLFFAVGYVLVTAWERVGYARTIIVYKGLVGKLAGRVAELERRQRG
jgi:hypothetical protein